MSNRTHENSGTTGLKGYPVAMFSGDSETPDKSTSQKPVWASPSYEGDHGETVLKQPLERLQKRADSQPVGPQRLDRGEIIKSAQCAILTTRAVANDSSLEDNASEAMGPVADYLPCSTDPSRTPA